MRVAAPTLLFLAVVTACGSKDKPRPPRTSVPEHATELNPRIPDGTAEAHLACVGLIETACQTPDFGIDVVATALDYCRFMPNGDVLLAIDLADNAGQGLTLQLAGYTGPGSYPIDDVGRERVAVTGTTVNPRHTHQPAAPPGCGDPGLSTAIGESPMASCTGCQVEIVDPDATATFPKPMGFNITCPKLCHADTQVCSAAGGGDIRINVRVDCTNG